MGRPWPLESFDGPGGAPGDGPGAAPPGAAPALAEADMEEERLAAFDKGYKAGWDDAAAAHAEEQSHITAEFAGNLQRLSFTYHEARNAVLAEMEPLLRGLVDKILPEVLRPSLGEIILSRVEAAMQARADIAVELVVSPANHALMQGLVEDKVAPPLRILEEPSLGEGQAFLRLGEAEEKIDLDQVLAEISGAMADFFHDPSAHLSQEANHA